METKSLGGFLLHPLIPSNTGVREAFWKLWLSSFDMATCVLVRLIMSSNTYINGNQSPTYFSAMSPTISSMVGKTCLWFLILFIYPHLPDCMRPQEKDGQGKGDVSFHGETGMKQFDHFLLVFCRPCNQEKRLNIHLIRMHH